MTISIGEQCLNAIDKREKSNECFRRKIIAEENGSLLYNCLLLSVKGEIGCNSWKSTPRSSILCVFLFVMGSIYRRNKCMCHDLCILLG